MIRAEIGVLGLGVMGKNLSRNLANNGFRIALYNRHVEGVEENVASDFKSKHPELKKALDFDNLSAFVQSLEIPRKIILMVNAGKVVDLVVEQLADYLEEGDIIIDAGNSHFQETNRRIKWLNAKRLNFIGIGVSGGEQGALLGPSIMSSGDQAVYLKIQKYLEAIAAKDSNNKPCCVYVGPQGSGHFVKMIHNGIEYVEMQLLADCYTVLKQQGKSNEAMADIFEKWIEDVGSYLLSITVEILRKKDNNTYVLDIILDKATNKGTGKWATATIADCGEPATMIPSALFARYISFFKEKRQQAASLFSQNSKPNTVNSNELKSAYQFSRIINHHQGFSLIKRVSDQNEWGIDLNEIARIWTEGCIIKSELMKSIATTMNNDKPILFTNPWYSEIETSYTAMRYVVLQGIESQLHIPSMMEAINYFHGIKTSNGSANLIQAQRDYLVPILMRGEMICQV